MAHALRHSAYRQTASTSFHPPSWWLPGLGIAAVIFIAAIGISALDGTPADERDSQGIAIVIGAPVASELQEPQSQDVIVLPEVAAPQSTELSQPPAVITSPPSSTTTGTEIDIRDVDLGALPLLQALAAQLHGRVDRASIKYADLTGDGRDEAIVSVTSDGTFGNLAAVVFTETSDGPQEILTRLSGLDRKGPSLSFEAGQLIETVGIYGPFDANCCPGLLAKTYFQWDGNRLIAARTEMVANPNRKQAK